MKIDIEGAPQRHGTGYPPPYDAPCLYRQRRQLGDAAGLTQFGVNLLHLPPGQWSSQRHAHTTEDEFVWVVSGEVTLVTDTTETTLRPGDCAGFKSGTGTAHHLQNRADAPAILLEIGSRREDDAVTYPDIDLLYQAGADGYSHTDGRPY